MNNHFRMNTSVYALSQWGQCSRRAALKAYGYPEPVTSKTNLYVSNAWRRMIAYITEHGLDCEAEAFAHGMKELESLDAPETQDEYFRWQAVISAMFSGMTNILEWDNENLTPLSAPFADYPLVMLKPYENADEVSRYTVNSRIDAIVQLREDCDHPGNVFHGQPAGSVWVMMHKSPRAIPKESTIRSGNAAVAIEAAQQWMNRSGIPGEIAGIVYTYARKWTNPPLEANKTRKVAETFREFNERLRGKYAEPDMYARHLLLNDPEAVRRELDNLINTAMAAEALNAAFGSNIDRYPFPPDKAGYGSPCGLCGYKSQCLGKNDPREGMEVNQEEADAQLHGGESEGAE